MILQKFKASLPKLFLKLFISKYSYAVKSSFSLCIGLEFLCEQDLGYAIMFHVAIGVN